MFLGRNWDPATLSHYWFFLHSLIPLISSCLDMPFGPQTGWKQKEDFWNTTLLPHHQPIRGRSHPADLSPNFAYKNFSPKTIREFGSFEHELPHSPCLALTIPFSAPNSDGPFPGGSDSKEFTCSAGDLGLIPRSRRSPGEGNGYPVQYACLENSMDRGAWWLNDFHCFQQQIHLLILSLLGNTSNFKKYIHFFIHKKSH